MTSVKKTVKTVEIRFDETANLWKSYDIDTQEFIDFDCTPFDLAESMWDEGYNVLIKRAEVL